MAFCGGLRLLKKEVSLMERRAALDCVYKDKCPDCSQELPWVRNWPQQASLGDYLSNQTQVIGQVSSTWHDFPHVQLACHCGTVEQNVGCFAPLADPVAPQDTAKANPQGEGLGSDAVQLLHLASKVLSVFSNGDLIFNFWEPAEGSSNSLYCFRSLLDSHDQQLFRRNLLDSLWLLGEVLSLKWHNFI